MISDGQEMTETEIFRLIRADQLTKHYFGNDDETASDKAITRNFC